MNQLEGERVYPYKFYCWIEGDNPGWKRFSGHDELEYRIDQEITKCAIPLPVMFYLNGSDILSDNRPGIHDFMGNVTVNSAIKIPLRDSINHSEGYVRLKKDTQSTLIFKPGIYNFIFAYLFLPTTSLTSSCKDSSYFMDFPFYPKEGVMLNLSGYLLINTHCPYIIEISLPFSSSNISPEYTYTK